MLNLSVLTTILKKRQKRLNTALCQMNTQVCCGKAFDLTINP